MNSALTRLYVSVQSLLAGQEGQDLVEYGLLAGMIATAAISLLGSLAQTISTMFANISTSLA